MRIEEVRDGFANRLRRRRAEILQAALARISSIADPGEVSDPEYLEGLKAAVSAALDYGIDALERSEDRPPPTPTVLLAQARLAARHGVKLDTVLRRYLAGYTLLCDFLIEESERDGSLDGNGLKTLLRTHATLLDRLLATISDEFGRELDLRPAFSTKQRRAERIERLLAGERLQAAEFAYDFDAHHLGVVASGPEAAARTTDLIRALDCRRLVVEREEAVWVWLGSRDRIGAAEVERQLSGNWPGGIALAIGEPAEEMAGWRLTHRQARAALSVARMSPTGIARYGEAALLASTLQDDLLATSLKELYLAPLTFGRDGGEVSRKTLRAYFAAEQNVTSAAAALGVSRNTVASRLRTIERLLGKPLASCGAELVAALRLEEVSGNDTVQIAPLKPGP